MSSSANPSLEQTAPDTSAPPESEQFEKQAEPDRQLTAAEVRFANAFTRMILVLMKSEPYRRLPLEQIERVVTPPLLYEQFAILDGDMNGRRVPHAVAFWAFVSEEVDRRLSDCSTSEMLRPEDWRSGDIPWLVDAVGQPQAVKHLLRELQKKTPAGRPVKMRRASENGTLVISHLSELIFTDGQPSDPSPQEIKIVDSADTSVDT